MNPPPPFLVRATPNFDKQAARLPGPVFQRFKSRLAYLKSNPRHPSLQTHEVKEIVGNFGGKVFEAYVTEKYRMTWEYGPSRGQITLRNLDNHDDCLRSP